MTNRDAWCCEVDDEMQRLRAHFLGEDISLLSFVPNEIAEDERIMWLTDWLAFHLLSKHIWLSKAETLRMKDWLYAALTYLDKKISSEDFCFASLIKIFGMSSFSRGILFAGMEPKEIFERVTNESETPDPLKYAETVFVFLVPDKVYEQRRAELKELGKIANQDRNCT